MPLASITNRIKGRQILVSGRALGLLTELTSTLAAMLQEMLGLPP